MASLTTRRSVRLAQTSPSISDLCVYLGLLQLPSRRTFHASKCRKASEPPAEGLKAFQMSDSTRAKPDHLKMTPAKRAEFAAQRARDKMNKIDEDRQTNRKRGSLAPSSIFGDEMLGDQGAEKGTEAQAVMQEALSSRNFELMSRVTNPRPNARARWQRMMLIRHIRKGGRLSKETVIARTERSHLARSHFFKTSMKKLAPLARQIAGKSVDEAILQMRFSKKKAAQDVLQHLIQTKNEAIAIKGMGLNSSQPAPTDGPMVADPSITPAGEKQRANKKSKDGSKSATDMYVAEAWTNRGPYGRQAEYRARGRVYMMRPPHTGLSVLLKEEKTRTRVKIEQEEKAIRKRMGKNMWTQLPDRPITNQHQHVLW